MAKARPGLVEVSFGLRITREMLDALKADAHERNVSPSALAREFIAEGLARSAQSKARRTA